MKYTKLIALLATMFVAVSCVNHDLEFDGGKTDTNTEADLITVYGNVARFADCEVNTRANKTPEESYVSRMALAVFPIVDGVVDDCIHYELRDGSNLLYTVDRAKINEKYGDQYEDTPCVMYILANMPQLPSSYNGSADDLLNLALTSPGLARPEDGFPMIGSLGDINRDGKEFVLMPMTGNRMGLPTVNGTPTDYLNIPMSAIFAKISFEIAVTPDQDVDVNAPSRFEMTGYEVHNLAERVSFNSELNKEKSEKPENNQPVITNPDHVDVSMTGIAQGGNEGSGSIIEFDFYLPERLLTPETLAENYDYPLGENGTIVGYNDIPKENKKYAQRYKPELLGENQQATYVTIKGKYRDHHENYYDVSYNIYLGEDNYGDFNIKRNNQYYNKLNIKGVTSSVDQSDNPNAISIDHRVNVQGSSPLIISLRRETQLDAHYEVRPLRLRFPNGYNVPDDAIVTVEVLNEDGNPDSIIPSWVRLEKSGDTANHITSGVSAGKRKYFTTNLVTNTLVDGYKVTFDKNELSTGSNSTVWIYVDEADPKVASYTHTTRSATIRVTYEYEGKEDVKDYQICQYNLHKITGESKREYLIECFEEYLYNYDSEDLYGQTKQEGMPWGLNGVQLSKTYYSFDPNLTPNVNWTTYETKATRPYYDFYIKKHDSFASSNGGTVREYPGQAFTQEIAQNSKAGVKALTMEEQANGAVEYCYNRNKRQSDGSIKEEDIVWYLPSADELEDFIVPAYNYYEEFQDNYYWTSQPAYIRNIFYYQASSSNIASPTVYDDNTYYARATKVVREEGEFKYAKSGLDSVPTPMVDRTEDGYTNLGYFYQMHYWKGRNDYGPVKEGTLAYGDERYTLTTGPWYNQKKYYYYIHLGFLDDLMQEGYHPRTKSNRVRCVRRSSQTESSNN